MQDDRDRLLDAALTHVPFEGMNDRALAAGARDIGMAADLARVHFPGGGAALAAAYHRRADAQGKRLGLPVSELLGGPDGLDRTVFANEHGVIGQHGSISVACQDAGTGQSYGRGHRHHLLAERRSLQHSPECRRSDSSCTM